MIPASVPCSIIIAQSLHGHTVGQLKYISYKQNIIYGNLLNPASLLNIMSKLFLFYIILTFINPSCDERNKVNQKVPNNLQVENSDSAKPKHSNNLLNDSSKFTILKKRAQVESIFSNKYKSDTLNKFDYTTIENLLIEFIDSFNIEGKKRMDKLADPLAKIDWNVFVIDTSRYRFQIIVATNNKKEKFAWVNAFCNANQIDWKRDIIIVLDGGLCYFNGTINLTDKRLISFLVNTDE
jgi:hypothetical protein